MNMKDKINSHYVTHRNKYVKRVANWSGSVENAEDIVQTAYLRALLYSDSYHQELDFDKWFSRILNNSFKDFKRQERGQLHDEFDEEKVDGVDDYHYLGQLRRQILEEMETYPEHHKEIISLFFHQGYTPRNIVKVVDERYKNVVTILDRFKRSIKEKYGESVCS